MASKLLLVALLATALFVVPSAAQAASAGFCAFAACPGVNTDDLPLDPGTIPPPVVGCNNATGAMVEQMLSQPPGTIPGGIVVVVCV